MNTSSINGDQPSAMLDWFVCDHTCGVTWRTTWHPPSRRRYTPGTGPPTCGQTRGDPVTGRKRPWRQTDRCPDERHLARQLLVYRNPIMYNVISIRMFALAPTAPGYILVVIDVMYNVMSIRMFALAPTAPGYILVVIDVMYNVMSIRMFALAPTAPGYVRAPVWERCTREIHLPDNTLVRQV